MDTPVTQARPVSVTRKRGRHTLHRLWKRRVLSAVVLLGFLFLYLPIIILILFSFNDSRLGGQWEGFTINWYLELLQNTELIRGLITSLKVAGISTSVATIFGTLAALGMERYRFRGQSFFSGLFYMPIAMPDIAIGVALLAFFTVSMNVLNYLFGWDLQMGVLTITLAHTAFSIAFVTVTVRTVLKEFDYHLEEAAADLGANEWQTFWRVTFPLILPGILAGALLVFTLSLDDYVIAFFTTGPGATTLPIEVYGRIQRSISPEINAVSTVMLIGSIVLVLLSQLLQRRR